MYRFFTYLTGLLLVTSLVSCNQQKEEGEGNRNGAEGYQQLSNEQPPVPVRIENPTGQIRHETELLPNPDPDNPVNEDQGHQADRVPANERLPFYDFKERWNALSEEQGTDLEILGFERSPTSDGYVYGTNLENGLSLRIYVNNDTVSGIQVSEPGNTLTERFQLLTCMSQVFLIMNRDAEPHEADYLFNEFGIGPNANFERVQQRTIESGGIQYTLSPKRDAYQFEAVYID